MNTDTENPWSQRLGVWYIADDHPDAIAIEEAPDSPPLTFADLVSSAHVVANGLQRAGLTPGTTIGLALGNGVATIRWQMACEEIGLRFVLINPALSTAELEGIIDHSNMRAIASDEHNVDLVAAIAGGHDLLRIGVGHGRPGFRTEDHLVEGCSDAPPAERTAGSLLVYTSGTTGKPKGILRPLPTDDPSDIADMGKLFGHAFQMLPFDGPHLVSAGMYHAGCMAYYRGALNVGQSLVIMDRFDAVRSLQLIDDHRVTTAYMVPTQFVRLLDLPEDVRASFDGSSLKTVVHSAAPCPRPVKERMMDWWGPVIWETYGGTEGAATVAKPNRWLEKPGTVGRAVRGIRLLILDDDGRELPPNTVGNIYIDSGQRGFEYKDDPETTESVFRGKAFTIGDVGFVDNDGYLFITDRAKDMIISGGVNIYPAEVEGMLVLHPAIADAAVIGIPDDEWGESVHAVVELNADFPPSDALAAEIVQFCVARLAKFKCPRTIEFHESLPRTEAGKLMKRTLRDERWASAGRHV